MKRFGGIGSLKQAPPSPPRSAAAPRQQRNEKRVDPMQLQRDALERIRRAYETRADLWRYLSRESLGCKSAGRKIGARGLVDRLEKAEVEMDELLRTKAPVEKVDKAVQEWERLFLGLIDLLASSLNEQGELL